MKAEEQARADIVEVGRRLWERGFVASNDGNISVRLDDSRLITTPKSVSKGFMTPDMMVVTDLDGKRLSGEREPSSELKMHLEVYRNRPDARAVVHAHPPTATGFAVAGIALDRAVLAEVITTLGSIPIAQYATPSTEELPAAVRKYVKAHDGLLLANHGALALAGDVMSAYYRMETIEHFAKDQPCRPHAWPGKPAVAGRGRAVTGASRDVRHCVPGAHLHRRFARRRADNWIARWSRHPTRGNDWWPQRAGESAGESGESADQIRLTYRELTALIEDALRALK